MGLEKDHGSVQNVILEKDSGSVWNVILEKDLRFRVERHSEEA